MADATGLIATDTATICIFDPVAMRHRKDDVGDWWSIRSNELAEVRSGNALILNVGQDGEYRVEVSLREDPGTPGFCLSAPSGHIFVGPGEEMSGGGFEPNGEWGGFFISVEPTHHKVCISRSGDLIAITIQPTEPFDNDLPDLIRI